MLSPRLLLIAFASLAFCDKLDYYELLGIAKTATNQEIRIAFKKLALTLHPDKNRDDPEASEKFIKVTRAYEVLKDADKRKQYDLTGEDNDKARPEYHSYTYYRDHFGIYDDDEHIVTLSHVDFEAEVEGTDTQWFINFYSPMCHHCHKLAPAWRSLASKFNGAIYFGAVNCEETWSLCRQINIHQYPSLVFFPDDERLVGMKSQEELETFIMTKLKSDMVHIKSESTWDSHKETKPNWLLMLSSSTDFPKDYNIIASMLKGLIGVAVIYCEWMPCEDWGQNEGFLYMTKTGLDIWAYSPITGTEPRDAVDEVLRLLPGLQKIDEAKFQKLTRQLEQGSEQPWLIFFHMGAETNVDIETKKLKALLPDFNLGSINCGKNVNICQDLSIARYPQFVIFKTGGGREFHHGKETAQSVAAFAVEAASATNFRSISEKEFFSGIQDGGPFFVDFYTPWCPPCLRLLPQLRKASLSFTPEQVSFAVVDCTVHRELCAHQGVRAYPTTVLFNSTRKPQTFKGQTAASIVEFIQDVVHSHVIELNSEIFYKTVAKKKIGTIWMVGFFMPWCQPCQQLSPHWRRLAKMVSDIPSVKIGEVNCEEETILCQEQGVRSYPHIRLYPHDSEDLSKVVIFSSYHRDAESLRRWLFNFVPSPVTELTPEDFFQITSEDDIWLIDFYAPWCGHCVSFDPDFKTIAKKLEGSVKCGKLNCQDYPDGCRRAGVSGYPTVKLYGPQFKQGVEIHSQHQSVIIESVQNLLSRKSRFIDEL